MHKNIVPGSNLACPKFKKLLFITLTFVTILFLNTTVSAQMRQAAPFKTKHSKTIEYSPVLKKHFINPEERIKNIQGNPWLSNPSSKTQNNNNQSFFACDGTYCIPSFNNRVMAIYNVTFAGINNSSTTINGGSTPDLEAFCDTATVAQGETTTITLSANSNGSQTFYEKAYFDWNQNNVFGDVADEIYYLGTYQNPSGTVSFSASITVPTGATLGTTRMRIMHRRGSYSSSSCQTGPGRGQAEDYNVTVTAPTSYCTPESQNNESSLYFDDVEFIGTLNDISNLSNSYSSTSPVGYQDFTALTNSIQAQGQGINISVESTYRGHIKAWVDWNTDFSFDEATELVFDTGNIATSSTTFGFIIPSSQPIGNYTIRIRTYNSFHYSFGTENYNYNYTACETFYQNGAYDEYGETEDYTFTVIENCAVTIDSITEGNNCGDGAVTLGATGSSGTTQYNWYANEADVTPIITTASTTWVTPSLTSSTTYYVTADNGTCESLVKTPVIATIITIPILTFTPTALEVCGSQEIIEITASATNEITYLINEDFEGTGLGIFANNNIVDNGAIENAITNWTLRPSTYIPTEQVWFPAISSGFGTNNFVMATSDVTSTNITENALESVTLDTSTFTSLTLDFDIYFSRYLFGASPDIPENVNIEVSTNGGTSWTSIQVYNDDVGYGTNFANVSLNLSSYINETNLKIRYRYYANYWCDGVAIDNIKFYGTKPLATSFTWTSATSIDAYTDPATTIPYTTGNTASTVYIRPTATQLQLTSFSFIANVTLSNGCAISENILVSNKTRYWTGASSNLWSDPNNWSPAGVPTSSNCVVIPDQCIINGTNYDAYAQNLEIEPTGNLELQSSNNLTVTEWVDINTNGIFNIRDSASLVQTNNDSNSGIARLERDTQPMYRYDYTYWGSPMTTASNFKLLALSPVTLADKFFSWQPTVSNGNGNWTLENAASTNMVNGVGYAIRAPQTFSTNPTTKVAYTGTFIGTPANGDINIPITIGTDANVGTTYGDTAVAADDDQWNLIGNPYPSAINVVSFLNSPTNSTLLDGTAYLWTHNTAPDASFPDPFYADFGANYTGSDYATVNSLGTTTTAASGGVTPSQYIASGQSFFVMGLSNGTAVFENVMRETNNNNVFLRTTENEVTTTFTTIEKHRLWLNLSNDNGAFSQILVGYAEGASSGWNRGLDGLANGGNFVSFYSIIPEGNLSIQGRPLPFSITDVVPLGYNATVQNTYRIGLDHIDPLFNTQNIYLRDTNSGFIHDLKLAPYIFTTEAGTFDNRFELIFNNNTLSTSTSRIETNSIKVITKETLNVISSIKRIKHITAYDILGKKLQEYTNINTTSISLKGIEKANRVLVLKITLEDDSVIYKKPIF